MLLKSDPSPFDPEDPSSPESQQILVAAGDDDLHTAYLVHDKALPVLVKLAEYVVKQNAGKIIHLLPENVRLRQLHYEGNGAVLPL